MKHKNYLLPLLGIALLWSNNAFTMIKKEELTIITEEEKKILREMAQITLFDKQIKIIEKTVENIQPLLDKMKREAQRTDKSAQHIMQKLNSLKTEAYAKIDHIKKHITDPGAISKLDVLKKKIKDKYEIELKKQARLRVDKILETMENIRKITFLNEAKKDAESLIAYAKTAITTEKRLEKLEKLQQKMKKKYKEIRVKIEKRSPGESENFKQINERLSKLKDDFETLYRRIFLYGQYDYPTDLENITRRLSRTYRHLNIILDLNISEPTQDHKQWIQLIKQINGEKWVQLINNSMLIVKKWYLLFSGKDPDFNLRMVTSKRASHYSGKWYNDMMAETKKYEKMAKEFAGHRLFGKSSKSLQKLFQLMNRQVGKLSSEKGGMLNGVYYTVGYPSLNIVQKKISQRRDWSPFKQEKKENILKKQKEKQAEKKQLAEDLPQKDERERFTKAREIRALILMAIKEAAKKIAIKKGTKQELTEKRILRSKLRYLQTQLTNIHTDMETSAGKQKVEQIIDETKWLAKDESLKKTEEKTEEQAKTEEQVTIEEKKK